MNANIVTPLAISLQNSTVTNRDPIESVSKMLGHKNLRTTQHYAKVLDRKVSDDMKILKDKFKIRHESTKIVKSN